MDLDPGALLAALNDEQRRAVRVSSGPLCIFAGAGTGKTRTITYRIAYQVATGVAHPSAVLAVTFTDKAAVELRARLAALGLPSPVRAATFHAAAWAQLRHFWPRLSDDPLPDVLPSKVRLLVPLARRTRTQAQDLAAEIEWAKARRLPPDGYAEAAAGRDAPLPPEQMAEVFERYERDKQRGGLIDYEDMLLRTTEALHAHPELAEEVRSRYRFFTVDEFQDVNPAQFALLQAWLGGRDELCVVGDDDQTIFSFTGATASYLLRFADHFPGADVVTLTRNYRSSPQVLEVANRVLWTKPAAQRKRLRATRDGGPAPVFVEHDDAEAEVEAAVRQVQALLDEGVPAGEIALCYRVNSQSEPLEAALSAARIPFLVRGEASFYERSEVRQALRVLRAAAEQPDAPPPGLEGTVRARPPALRTSVERVLRDRMGYDPRREPDGGVARERWRNLATLVEIAEQEAGSHAPLAEAVALLEGRARGGEAGGDDVPAVNLLTLHRAKGLEFDAVFLLSVEEGLLPISYAKTDEEVEEERRLLYVGVTRARRHLTVSWARRRPGWGGKITSRRPSRFLYGLGAGAPTKSAPAAGKRRGGSSALDTPGVDAELAERLRAWRRQRAADDEVPAFVVFADTTLAELARLRPRSERELLRVKGLGPAKVSRYGAELLRVLSDR